MVKFLVVISLVACTAVMADQNDWTGFGLLESRLCKPIAPLTYDLGAGVAMQITTLPSEWLVVGGRKVFGDIVYTVGSQFIWGGSISLSPATKDEGYRLGMAYKGDTKEIIIHVDKGFPFIW